MGDTFLRGIVGNLQESKNKSENNKQMPTPYLFDYYNTTPYYQKANEGKAMTQILNSVIEAFNERDHLPKYIIFILDKDIIKDVDVFSFDAVKTLGKITAWLIKQINLMLRCRRADLTERRPRAVFQDDPKLVFCRMIRRIEHQPLGSHLDKVFSLRAKFNDALNDAVIEIDQHMLTINSCNSLSHFDRWGKLTHRGQTDFWEEIDELLERFDIGKIKLLPNPKQPRGCQQYKHQAQHFGGHARSDYNHTMSANSYGNLEKYFTRRPYNDH